MIHAININSIIIIVLTILQTRITVKKYDFQVYTHHDITLDRVIVKSVYVSINVESKFRHKYFENVDSLGVSPS